MLTFCESTLNSLLEPLGPKRRFAFALSCCERLYPNYVAFVRKYRWGDSSILREALDSCWSRLRGDLDEIEVENLKERLEAITPDTDDFSGTLVSPALDAAVAAHLLMESLTDDSISTIIDIASLCRDTVDMHLSELENLDSSDPNTETKIMSHKLMQAELLRQRVDIEVLSRVDLDDVREVDALARKWKNPSSSNIGL